MADDSPKLLSAVGDLVRSRRGMEWAGIAADAEAVLAALPAARPDVVLLDVSMRGAAGIRVASEISARWPGAVVVALTAPADPSTMAEMLSAGAVAHLVKGSHTVGEIELASGLPPPALRRLRLPFEAATCRPFVRRRSRVGARSCGMKSARCYETSTEVLTDADRLSRGHARSRRTR